MIRVRTAQRIAGTCHGGQWSALYQFASNGIYLKENHLRYLQEVETALHPEYDLYPGELSKKQEKQLNGLKYYFLLQGNRNGLKTVWGIHPKYGYNIPFADENTPKDILEKLHFIEYLL